MPVSPAVVRLQRRRAQKGGAITGPVFSPPPGLWISDAAPTFAPRDFTQYYVAYSASIKSTISPYTGVFSCLLDGPAAVMATIKHEQELTWNRDGVVYAGRIRSMIPTDQVIASAGVMLTIECQDFTTLLDRDICAYAVSAPQVSPVRSVIESDVQRINWLMQSFGKRGITLHHVSQNYASVPVADYTGMTLRKAIESVLAFSGASFYVDFAKDLHCFLDERQYAPFTLTETPDNSTTFPYGGLDIPADTFEIQNAIYGIPAVANAPAAADKATITSSTDPLLATNCPGVLASFKAAIGAAIARISIGAFLQGTNTSVSPLFGQATSAHGLLTACVNSDSADATTGAAGWVKAVSLRTGSGLAAAIWYKPDCAAGETAPTFTAAGGLGPMTAELAEFSGAALTDVLDQVASGSISFGSLALTAASIDVASGDVVIIGSHWGFGGSVTTAFTEAFNNGLAAVHMGDDGSTSQNHHASHAYAIGDPGGAVPKWYTDEASIALYGRHESSFKDTTVILQADLDALGAAVLARSSTPRQEGSFHCWKAGLVVGQRFTVQSSLYTIPTIVDSLGNYSGIVQSVTVTYPEELMSPKFDIEFLKPARTLAVQLGDIVGSIPAAAEPSADTDIYKVRARSSVAQTGVVTATWTLVNLDTFDYDPALSFNPTTHLITIQKSGVYRVTLRTQAAASGTRMGAQTRINGVQVGPSSLVAGGTNISAVAHDEYVFSKGDVVGLLAFQESGANQTLPAGGCLLTLLFSSPAS